MIPKVLSTALVCLACGGYLSVGFSAGFECIPTPTDMMGPFYEPGAPVRNAVGSGYLMTGTVKSAADCSPVPEAEIEFWLTGPHGRYDDAHRATLFADGSGNYRFRSNYPTAYGFRPPHIHIRVTANGFAPLVTQHYPEENATRGKLDLVLRPE